MELNTLGKRTKFLRKLLNLTQNDLANVTGMSQGNISSLEKDKLNFSFEAIISLYKYLRGNNISTEWLLTGIGEINLSLKTDIPPPEQIIDFDEFTNLKQDEKIMLRYYREITDKGRDEATKLMLELRDEYKAPKPEQPGTLSNSHTNYAAPADSEIADDLTYQPNHRYKNMANAV